MSKKPINTAIVGAGLAAKVFHGPLVLSLPSIFKLHTVVERSPPSDKPNGTLASLFNLKEGEFTLVNKYEQVLQDPNIELVIIATPNSTHYDFAKVALNAGKHVLVDKPITTTYEEAVELGEIAKRKNLVLYAFQNRRWDSDYLTFRRILKDGKLGHITDFESRYDRYKPGLKGSWKENPQPGSGLIYDLGSHLIDQALHSFGKPSRVTGFLQNLRGVGHPDVDDWFTIIMHYDRLAPNPYPLTVTLKGHPLSQLTPQLKYLVRGDKGTFIKYGLDVQEDQLKEHGPAAFGRSDYGVEPDELKGQVEYAEPGGKILRQSVLTEAGTYQALYENLGAAIRDGAELSVKWHEASLVMLITQLAVQSSKEGKTLNVPNVNV